MLAWEHWKTRKVSFVLLDYIIASFLKKNNSFSSHKRHAKHIVKQYVNLTIFMMPLNSVKPSKPKNFTNLDKILINKWLWHLRQFTAPFILIILKGGLLNGKMGPLLPPTTQRQPQFYQSGEICITTSWSKFCSLPTWYCDTSMKGTQLSWFHSTPSSAFCPSLQLSLPYLRHFYTNVCCCRPPFVWFTSSFGVWHGNSLPRSHMCFRNFYSIIIILKFSVLCHKIRSSKKPCSVLQLLFPHYENYFQKNLGNKKLD